MWNYLHFRPQGTEGRQQLPKVTVLRRVEGWSPTSVAGLRYGGPHWVAVGTMETRISYLSIIKQRERKGVNTFTLWELCVIFNLLMSGIET